jgi:hypothetical protein
MMEAESTSEMSVNFYQTTRCIIQEDSHLHSHRSENLKSQSIYQTARYYIPEGSHFM